MGYTGAFVAVVAAAAAAAAAAAIIVSVAGDVTVVVPGTHTYLVGVARQCFGSPSLVCSDQQDSRRTNLWGIPTSAY